ncbi:unnamed protein product, partial [Heterotrigona itama]
GTFVWRSTPTESDKSASMTQKTFQKAVLASILCNSQGTYYALLEQECLDEAPFTFASYGFCETVSYCLIDGFSFCKSR